VPTQQPTLLAEVAHELRAPLTALATGAEVLAADYERLDAEQVQELVWAIHRGAIWLQELVENLLCASTVQAGRLHIRPQSADLLDIVTDIESVLAPVLRQQGQALRVSARGARPRLWIDPRRLVQVLVNLILNASKFTETGHPIDLMVRGRRGHVRVTVADRGPGLPPGRAAQLFEPYYRAAPMARVGKPGVGLGLAVVRWIVERHGGRVGAQNRRGGGAVFWFELPGDSEALGAFPLQHRRGEGPWTGATKWTGATNGSISPWA
jgi:two-component system sensor histidine kinase KdpD